MCVFFLYAYLYTYTHPDELLPTHLRIAEGISWADKGTIASGWINTMRVLGKNKFVKDMSKLKLELCDDIEAAERVLCENKYVFDPICPKMINLHDKAREKLAVSDLVRDHRFIFLVSNSHLQVVQILCKRSAQRLYIKLILTMISCYDKRYDRREGVRVIDITIDVELSSQML